QYLPHLRGNLGELSELGVVAWIVGFYVCHVDYHRAERSEFRVVGVCSEPLFATCDKIRKPKRFVVTRHNDEKGLSRLAESPHLRFEHIDIDVWGGQYDSP